MNLHILIVYLIPAVVLSWLVIFLLERRNIFKQWLTPFGERKTEFLGGFLFMVVLGGITQLILAYFRNGGWLLAEDITPAAILNSVLFDLSSVLFEELLFRGVLLYLLIKYLSENKGIFVSSIAFGVYHWFTFGVTGNIPAMTAVFMTTGFMGFVFAFAYVKTGSIILPAGLHFGWNIINNTVFSNGPLGAVILTPQNPAVLPPEYQIVTIVWYLLIPSAVLLVLKIYFD